MTDLVIISLEVWDEVWRRNQHLIAGLLRSGALDRVLFVEPAVDAVHDLRRGRVPDGTQVGLRRVDLEGVESGRLWAFRPRKVLPRRVDRGGDRRRARSIARTARAIGMTRPLLWVNDPGGAEVMAATGWPSLYDITDDWLVADRPEVELVRLRRQEAELFAACREVVVCSEGLRQSRSTHREVVLVPNAVDLDAYRSRQPRPDDLPEGRVALYLGTAHRDRIDVDLCVTVARRAGGEDTGGVQASLVLVGPAPLPGRDLDRLRSTGALVLGPRPSRRVPAYLQHADVLLVPHVLTEFTASLDPIKAYEYRAARRPIVTTPVPGLGDATDPLVRVVDAGRFADAVVSGLRDPVPWSPDVPDDIPSWGLRVDQMAAVIERASRGGR